jgi:predicted dehydrogenase
MIEAVSPGVALLGAAHIHIDDLSRLLRSDGRARAASVWDHDAARAERWAAALGARARVELDHALDLEGLRGALVYSETSRHRALASAATDRLRQFDRAQRRHG